jgi:DNA-binding NarL/FixJ family response regulator
MPTRLLIVDDHEIVRLGLRTLFAKDDSFEICGEAQNGIEAIRRVLDLSPDVVILDLTMPGMNGFETAANIVTVAPSTRIVFFSAHEVPATAQWVGADAFVSKSSALEELLLTVSRVLKSSKIVRPQQKSMGATNTSSRWSHLEREVTEKRIYTGVPGSGKVMRLISVEFCFYPDQTRCGIEVSNGSFEKQAACHWASVGIGQHLRVPGNVGSSRKLDKPLKSKREMSGRNCGDKISGWKVKSW